RSSVCGGAIVITERWLVMHGVLDADQLPANRAAIAAVHGVSEEAEDGVETDGLEEFRRFDGFKEQDLLIRREARDAGGTGKHFGAFGLRLGEAALVEFALILIVTSQGAVDEPYDACAVRAGRVIVRNNPRGDGFDFERGSRIEEDEPGRSGRLGAQHFGP